MKKLISFLTIGAVALGMVSCDNEENYPKMPAGKYYVSLGVTINDVTTYYVVNTNDLMNGMITARGQGLEQTGYRDFQQNGNVLYSIGGLGTTDCNGLLIDKQGDLTEKGNFIFENKLDGFTAVDNNTMVAMELPKDQQKGGKLTFYEIDNNDVSITRTVKTTPVSPMDDNVDKSLNWWPTITGMCYSGNNVYVAYYPMHPLTCYSPDINTARVAVYSYPDMTFKTLMTDDRIGAVGSFNSFNALTKDEKGDIYVMSNTSMANGFSSNGERPVGFLRIRSGATEFDPGYQFNFYEKSGGYRPAHIVYVGGGKALVEYSTIKNPGTSDLWTDKDLKCAVVDLYNKEFYDVPDVPVHNGGGARRFAALADGIYVYLPVQTSEGLYMYRIDTEKHTAERGAQIEATFVGGVFAGN